MLISDWSSDVCSSDLYRHGLCSCGAGRTRHEGRNRSAEQASCGNRHSNAIRTAPLSSSRSPKMSRYFTDEHEWIDVEGDIATVGLTDYEQGRLRAEEGEAGTECVRMCRDRGGR